VIIHADQGWDRVAPEKAGPPRRPSLPLFAGLIGGGGMDISNKAAFLIGLFIAFGAFAMDQSGIEVAALPMLLFCIMGVIAVFLKNRADLKLKYSSLALLPDWLAGDDVMAQCKISLDMLIEYVRNGLPVYPAGILHDVTRDEAPPRDDIEWLLSSPDPADEFGSLCFKKSDIEKYVRK